MGHHDSFCRAVSSHGWMIQSVIFGSLDEPELCLSKWLNMQGCNTLSLRELNNAFNETPADGESTPLQPPSQQLPLVSWLHLHGNQARVTSVPVEVPTIKMTGTAKTLVLLPPTVSCRLLGADKACCLLLDGSSDLLDGTGGLWQQNRQSSGRQRIHAVTV